jgi:hypothetical protein
MAIGSFKLDQILTLLVPELVVVVVADVTFPSEANFIEKSLSIRSNFVVVVVVVVATPLPTNLLP